MQVLCRELDNHCLEPHPHLAIDADRNGSLCFSATVLLRHRNTWYGVVATAVFLPRGPCPAAIRISAHELR